MTGTVYVVNEPCDGYGGGGMVMGVFVDLDAVRAWYVSDENPRRGWYDDKRHLPGYQREFYPYEVEAFAVREMTRG